MLNQNALSEKAMIAAAQLEGNRLRPLLDRNMIRKAQVDTAKAKRE